MNQQQIDELRELKAKATPGEWRADWDDNGQWYIEPLGLTGHALRGDESDCIESATAQSIAALHNSADALLDAAERVIKLEAALQNNLGAIKRYREICAAQAGHHDDCACVNCNTSRQELAALAALADGGGK